MWIFSTHGVLIDPEIYTRLFATLPTLKIEQLEERQNDEDQDNYRDLITDKRTGKKYSITMDDGLMNYLTENVCNTIITPLLSEPRSWEVEVTLILAAKIEKEGESQVLKKISDLSVRSNMQKIFIKKINFVLGSGNHFEVGLKIRRVCQRAIFES